MAAAFVSVPEFLLSGRDPDRIALDLVDVKATYGDLHQSVAQVARCLVGTMGTIKGDRVVLIDENSTFWVAAYLGIMKAGAVAVPLPPAMSAHDLAHVLENTEARIVCANARWAASHASALAGMHLMTDVDAAPVPDVMSQTSFPEVRTSGPAPSAADPNIVPDDLAALMFTSGSTGQPRGVMVSHRNIIANTESIIESLELGASDRIMVVLPFHYCFGTSLLHTHLRVGGSLVIDRRFMYPEVVLERMIETRCTGFAGVPSHFQILLRKSGLAQKTFPDLCYVQQAGGRLPPSDIQQLREALPGTRIFIMYGQTEATARLACLKPELVESKVGSVGKAIPGVELRVVDETGTVVETGVTGEIVARGDNVARGYWRAPEASIRAFRDGVLHTGDVATVDEEGFIYIVDRLNDFLKIRGERVSCRQIEEALLAFDEVMEVAAVGTPDDVLGESVTAFVVPENGHASGLERRMTQFARETMPPHLVPREVVVMDVLPRNDAGKLDRLELRKRVEARV